MLIAVVMKRSSLWNELTRSITTVAGCCKPICQGFGASAWALPARIKPGNAAKTAKALDTKALDKRIFLRPFSHPRPTSRRSRSMGKKRPWPEPAKSPECHDKGALFVVPRAIAQGNYTAGLAATSGALEGATMRDATICRKRQAAPIYPGQRPKIEALLAVRRQRPRGSF